MADQMTFTDITDLFEERSQVIDANRTIYARAPLGTSKDDPKWQIWALDKFGTSTHKQFASIEGEGSPSNAFVHSYSNRADLFPIIETEEPVE